jgi:hypothetical protein
VLAVGSRLERDRAAQMLGLYEAAQDTGVTLRESHSTVEPSARRPRKLPYPEPNLTPHGRHVSLTLG